MSFLKFQENNQPQAGGIHWSRVDRDGAPFRGTKIPLLKEEEYEEFAQKVQDAKIGIFKATDPAHKQHGRTYQEVLDGILAGWFTLLSERQYKWIDTGSNGPEMHVYVEWSESYMQLPKNLNLSNNSG
jgi:hypothetical protein